MMLSDPELEELIRRAAPRDLPPRLGRLLARMLHPHAPRPELAWAGATLMTLLLIAGALLWFSARDTTAERSTDRPAPCTVPASHVEQAPTYQPCHIAPPL